MAQHSKNLVKLKFYLKFGFIKFKFEWRKKLQQGWGFLPLSFSLEINPQKVNLGILISLAPAFALEIFDTLMMILFVPQEIDLHLVSS